MPGGSVVQPIPDKVARTRSLTPPSRLPPAGGAAQQGDGLSDLGPVEEAGGAADDVGDLAPGQGVLERLGLRVDAEQDGDLAGGDTGRAQLRDLVGRRSGLGHLVGMGAVGHLRARLGCWATSSTPLLGVPASIWLAAPTICGVER